MKMTVPHIRNQVIVDWLFPDRSNQIGKTGREKPSPISANTYLYDSLTTDRSKWFGEKSGFLEISQNP